MIKKLLNSIFNYTSLLLITVGIANEASAQCNTTPADQNFDTEADVMYNTKIIDDLKCIKYSTYGDAYIGIEDKIAAASNNCIFRKDSFVFSRWRT